MSRPLSESMRHFRRYWKHYFLQCILTGSVIFCIFAAAGDNREVITASIGATAFIVFCLPDKFTARPRNVIGGHIAGLLGGYIGAQLCCISVHSHLWPAFAYAVAVGLCAFIMVLFDVEHPPAAGTALGVAIGGFTLKIAISVVLIVIVLSGIKYLFRKYLRDLT